MPDIRKMKPPTKEQIHNLLEKVKEHYLNKDREIKEDDEHERC